MSRLVAAWGVLGLLLLTAMPAHAGGNEVLFAFSDPRISEASALTPLGHGLYATTNDSGDSGRVFTVDSEGDTVGVTHWSRDPVDVEGLAPAGRRHVWVGDIGDNGSVRDSIQLAKVRVGRSERTVDPTTYDLVYPDGPHNAESLLAHPDGGVYVATKDWSGGRLYAVPKHLDPDRPNRLNEVAPALPMATDGAFFPDGKHLIIRGYYSATVYAWPSMDRVGSLRTPDQEQGEAIGVSSAGEVVVTSEGIRAEVIRVDPALVSQALGAASSPSVGLTASSSPTEKSSPESDASGTSDADDNGGSGIGGRSPAGPIALVVLAAAAAAYAILRKRR